MRFNNKIDREKEEEREERQMSCKISSLTNVGKFCKCPHRCDGSYYVSISQLLEPSKLQI